MNTFKSEGKEKWAQLIGHIMIGFGDIEYITLECLHMFPTENIFPSVSKMTLSSRIDLIINIVDSRFKKKENREPIIAHLKRAKELAKKRNLIAHNPMSLDVYEDKEGNITDFKEMIASLRNEHEKVHFKDLEQLEVDVNEVKRLLIDEYSRLSNDILLGKQT